MVDLPGPLHIRLRQALLDCGRFDSDFQLRVVFANELLAPWRYQLPQENAITDCVDYTINFLMNKWRSDSHMNALIIFLTLLRDKLIQTVFATSIWQILLGNSVAYLLESIQ